MTAPFALQGIDHIVLRVQDLPRALAFWRDVVGATLDHEQPKLGLYHLRVGGALIDLITLDGPLGAKGGAAPGAEGRNLDHVALTIAPFDEAAIRAHLAAHDVTVTESGPRYGAFGMGPSVYFLDPDGNTVELKGRA